MPEITIQGAATLVVVWRTGAKAHGRAVSAGNSIIQALREYAATAANLIMTSRNSKAYNPDDEQNDADFLTLERDDLLDTALLEEISQGDSLPLLTDEELKTKSLALYALVIGDDPDDRTIFIRRGTPVKLAKKGLVTRFFDNTLERIEAAGFLAFDEQYDMVINASGAWALDQRNFEALFKESEAVLAKTQSWADELGSRLPIEAESLTNLAERLRTSSLLRRKVQSILDKPYISTLRLEDLRERAIEQGLDPSQFIANDKILINKDNEKDVIYLLNEDLFIGPFSGDHYEVSRKSAR